MTKNYYLAALVTVAFLLAGCSAKVVVPKEPIVLDTFDKKLSYLFAFDSASLVKDVGVEFDINVIQQAIDDVNNDKEAMLTIEEAQATSRHFKLMQMESN